MIQCPHCGEKHARHVVARAEYDPVAPQLAGGVLLAFVYVLSRPRRFRCEQCGRRYFSHTLGSRVWLGVWILFWTILAIGILGLLTSGGRP